MQINGNLKFSVLGSGELQNAIIERIAGGTGGVSLPTAGGGTSAAVSAGRIAYNTSDNFYYYFNGTSWLSLASGTTSVSSFSGGATGLTPATATTGAIVLGGVLNAVSGGTGQSAYTVGDLLVASGTTALSKLGVGAAGTVLTGGSSPSYAQVDLTTTVTGVLPVPNGGTGVATLALNGVVVGAGTAAVTTAVGTAGQVLVAGPAPAFGSLDLSNVATVGSSILAGANGGTGVANTGKTITLGGNLTTSGSFASTFTMTGATSVTFPTSGTLATVGGTVASITGTANQIDVNNTDPQHPVLSLDETLIAPGTVVVTDTLGVTTNTASSFVYSDASKNLVTTSAPTNGQLLIGSTGAVPVAAALTASTGISITNGAGSITIANTGVTSVAATSSSAGLTVGGSPITTTGTLTFALSASLEALSELGAAAGTGFVVQTGVGTFTNQVITGTAGNIVVTNGSGVSASPTINLAAVAVTATGTTLRNITVDGFGRVTDAAATTAGQLEALIGTYYLPTAGGTMTGGINMGGQVISNVATPVAATDAANKGYVDAAVSGLSWKEAVQVIATSSITLSGLQTIDGYTTVAGDRVLVTGQTPASANGIYIAGTGAWARSSDLAAGSDAADMAVFVENGTVNHNTGWVQTTSPATTGTTALVYSQFSGGAVYVAGTGITISGNVVSVNYGAGIESNPSNDIGINLYNDASSALILTTDGATRSEIVGSGLALLLDSAGALAQTSAGLKINAASVTNAMLVHPSITVDVDSLGTTLMSLGDTFNFFGTSNRITTTATTDTVTFDIASGYVGQASITTLGTVTTGTWAGTTIAANHGGTGLSTFAVGDLLVANSTSTLTSLSDVAVGNVLISGGVGAAPSYGKVDLTAAVSGILPAANGGTGVNNSSTITLGGNINTAGSLTTAGAFASTFTMTGTTTVTFPTSGTLLSTANIAANAVTSFVTTMSGLTPSTAADGAVTLAGTLGVASGGTGATTLAAHGVVIGNDAGAVSVTAVGASGTVLKGVTGADPVFAAVNLTTDVTGDLPVANGGTGLTAVGAAGSVLSTTDGAANSYNQIQYVYTGASATTWTVTHNLGQKYVNVTVYDNTDNQIIPQSVTLTNSTSLVVTVNSAIAVTIVVMGIAGASHN